MYRAAIIKVLTKLRRLDQNPVHIEAIMRLEHPTLDGLSPRKFAAEVRIAVQCLDSDPKLGGMLVPMCGMR